MAEGDNPYKKFKKIVGKGRYKKKIIINRRSKLRNDLDYETKFRIISDSENGHSIDNLSKKYSLNKYCIKAIIAKKNRLEKDYTIHSDLKRKRISRVTKNHLVNKATYYWISENFRYATGSVIQSIARMIAKKLDNYKFRASNGWLECFRKKYGSKISIDNSEAFYESENSSPTNQKNSNNMEIRYKKYKINLDKSKIDLRNRILKNGGNSVPDDFLKETINRAIEKAQESESLTDQISTVDTIENCQKEIKAYDDKNKIDEESKSKESENIMNQKSDVENSKKSTRSNKKYITETQSFEKNHSMGKRTNGDMTMRLLQNNQDPNNEFGSLDKERKSNQKIEKLLVNNSSKIIPNMNQSIHSGNISNCVNYSNLEKSNPIKYDSSNKLLMMNNERNLNQNSTDIFKADNSKNNKNRGNCISNLLTINISNFINDNSVRNPKLSVHKNNISNEKMKDINFESHPTIDNNMNLKAMMINNNIGFESSKKEIPKLKNLLNSSLPLGNIKNKGTNRFNNNNVSQFNNPLVNNNDGLCRKSVKTGFNTPQPVTLNNLVVGKKILNNFNDNKNFNGNNISNDSINTMNFKSKEIPPVTDIGFFGSESNSQNNNSFDIDYMGNICNNNLDNYLFNNIFEMPSSSNPNISNLHQVSYQNRTQKNGSCVFENNKEQLNSNLKSKVCETTNNFKDIPQIGSCNNIIFNNNSFDNNDSKNSLNDINLFGLKSYTGNSNNILDMTNKILDMRPSFNCNNSSFPSNVNLNNDSNSELLKEKLSSNKIDIESLFGQNTELIDNLLFNLIDSPPTDVSCQLDKDTNLQSSTNNNNNNNNFLQSTANGNNFSKNSNIQNVNNNVDCIKFDLNHCLMTANMRHGLHRGDNTVGNNIVSKRMSAEKHISSNSFPSALGSSSSSLIYRTNSDFIRDNNKKITSQTIPTTANKINSTRNSYNINDLGDLSKINHIDAVSYPQNRLSHLDNTLDQSTSLMNLANHSQDFQNNVKLSNLVDSNNGIVIKSNYIVDGAKNDQLNHTKVIPHVPRNIIQNNGLSWSSERSNQMNIDSFIGVNNQQSLESKNQSLLYNYNALNFNFDAILNDLMINDANKVSTASVQFKNDGLSNQQLKEYLSKLKDQLDHGNKSTLSESTSRKTSDATSSSNKSINIATISQNKGSQKEDELVTKTK